MADDDTIETIDQIYAAVGDPQRWEELLGRLSGRLSPELQAHLEIARQAHQRHIGLATEIATLSDVHAQLGIAALLVDERGTVTWRNRAAARLFEDDDAVLRLVHGCLRAADAREHTTLVDTIVGAASAERERLPFVLLSRPGRGPLTVFALRPRSAPAALVEERRVLLLVVDPEAINPPSTRTTRELFGFTAREAECAALLMEGRSLDEAARIMGIRRSTARTFLARITAKTDSHSQAEFVGRLLSIPHGLDVA